MTQQNTLSGLLASKPSLAKLAKKHAGLPEIAAMLIELRHQLGLSQKEFAAKAGVSKTMISELENAANDGVTLRTLARIARGGHLKLNLSFEATSNASDAGRVEATLNLQPATFVLSNHRIKSVVSSSSVSAQPCLLAA